MRPDHVPVLQFPDWPSLLAAVRESPALGELRGADDESLIRLLNAAATVAWWLAGFTPELLARDKLRVLLVGLIGDPEMIDFGRPYQLLPVLLGRPGLDVQVSSIAIGLADDDSADSRPLGLSLVGRGIAPVPLLAGGEQAWREALQNSTPDVCLLFHPPFDTDHQFWRGLAAVIGRGTPVGAFARGPERLDRDLWLLEAYGYAFRSDAGASSNPFARDNPASPGHGAWGALGWRVPQDGLPRAPAKVDVARLERARAAQQFIVPELSPGNALATIGQCVAGADGELYIALPDDYLLSRRTGEVLMQEGEGLVPARAAVTIDAQLLATYPERASRNFERFVWAVEVYLDRCRPAQTALLAAAQANEMQELQAVLALRLKGRAEAAQLGALVDHYAGAIPTTAVTPGAQELFRALRTRHWPRAESMIADDAQLLHAHDDEGRTPLFYVFAARELRLADQWLSRGADPDHLDQEGFAVVHDVAKRLAVEPLELLHRYGANLDLPTKLGFTPALIALQYGIWPILAYLIAQGVDLRRENLLGNSVADQFAHSKTLPGALRRSIETSLGLPPSGYTRKIPIAARSART